MSGDARRARERLDPGDSVRGPALHLEGASYRGLTPMAVLVNNVHRNHT